MSSYAGEFINSRSVTDYTEVVDALTEHANQVSGSTDDLGISISAPKSIVTLFASDKRQSHNHRKVTF